MTRQCPECYGEGETATGFWLEDGPVDCFEICPFCDGTGQIDDEEEAKNDFDEDIR